MRKVQSLFLVSGALALLPLPAIAASELAPSPGIREKNPSVQAFVHARIVPAPGKLVEDGTLVARDGVIVTVGKGVTVPKDAVVVDLTGYTIYAGFLDGAVEMGPGASGAGPAVTVPDNFGALPPPRPAPPARAGQPYWSRFVTPELAMDRELPPDSLSGVTARRLRSQGVTDMVAVPSKGVIKGTSAVVALCPEDVDRSLQRAKAALHVSFESPLERGETDYPDSRMGAYALARQAFYDADWYARAGLATKDRGAPKADANDALAALGGVSGGTMPVVVDAQDEQDDMRADRFGKEFRLPIVIRGNGREYRRIDDVKATGRAVLVPVNFPKPPMVDTPEQEANVSLETLMAWDLAPDNASKLAAAKIPFAFTSDRLERKDEFLAGVRKAVERGLAPDAALAALTTTPAKIYGVDDRLGTLEAGKRAHLVVTDGDLFSKRTKVREVWIEGRRYDVRPRPKFDARGRWIVDAVPPPAGAAGDTLALVLEGLADSLGGSFHVKKDAKLTKAELLESRLLASAPGDSLGMKGVVRLSGTIEGASMTGSGEWPDGVPFAFTARRVAAYTAPPDTAKAKPPVMASYAVNYPLGDFGRDTPEPPRPAAVAFTHATVWTSGPAGTIVDGTVVVKDGKIAAVGKDVTPPGGAIVVDARGKHLTAGLIDCHSHTATDGGVNEAGQTVTAEVRIGDFIDANDIATYRELAGGLTMMHVLHGSANAIGGQCQLVKLLWGQSGEAMKADYPPTIKFALGENPKQANWGERFTTRYPQTRMGVEQIIRDEFEAAREYEKTMKAGRDASGMPARRDLELDAIAEVLDGKRIIHCHSYRQDEIHMLMRVCDDFGVKIGTFQHILEGYKVADEMAARGIGGSTFSDWWAYKIEVQDAIPYNGAIMRDQGVVVSFNSDSDELARRLNSEAGKAVKYGDVPAAEALKFVTINPAKQLKIDSRVGSIEVGKDADLALWSGDPLSPRTRCEQTWIDGRKYFDRDDDLAMRKKQDTMRSVLVQKALAEAATAGAGAGPRGRTRGDVYDVHEADDGWNTDGADQDEAHDCLEGGAR